MHPRTQEILTHLDTCRAALEQAVADVPASLHGRRPAAERWSVSEIIEHLGLVEGRIAPLLITQLGIARAAGLGAERETSPVVPTFDMSRLLDRSKPLTAGDTSLPRAGLSTSAGWAILTEHRRTLREAIIAADGLALGTIHIPHPRLGVLDVYQWLVFVGGHEARHTAQVREVGAAVKGS
jgi:DinB superfamily